MVNGKSVIKNRLALLAGKISLFLINSVLRRPGSTWPGEIALILNKSFISEMLEGSGLHVILVAGTNGKTTTSALLEHVLAKKSAVFRNAEGANLLSGIASALIKNFRFDGKTNFKYAVLETDENTLSMALAQTFPDKVIILNLFRDQLDRYGEVNTIAMGWKTALAKLDNKTTVFLNADDPLVNYFGSGLQAVVKFFGLPRDMMAEKPIGHDVDSVHCPVCGNRLAYRAVSFSHLGDYSCPKCGYSNKETAFILPPLAAPALKGLYNRYNVAAALAVLKHLPDFPINETEPLLIDFVPAFGRQEEIEYHGRKIKIILAKNPAGFNQAVETANAFGDKKSVMLALNDRVPDGRDVSWIWDVDFDKLKADKIVVTGDRVYDMGLRIKYAGHEFSMEENLEKAIDELASQQSDQLVILATYSAMLEARKILTGKKLL